MLLLCNGDSLISDFASVAVFVMRVVAVRSILNTFGLCFRQTKNLSDVVSISI